MLLQISIIALWNFLCAFLQYVGKTSADSLVVDTTHGKIEGFEEQVGTSKLHIYLGVPFAKPPVGSLRFKPPEDASSWDGVKPATKAPPACTHPNDTSYNRFPGVEMWNPITGISEDCLYLNIWANADDTKKPKAVMVWIYGGSFYSGSASLDLYNGKKLAAGQDVIVVALNYRLGPLGFFYNGQKEAPGNVGLLDQQLALRWVKENIAVFGGDNNRITLFGESAGSASVSYHLLSQGSRDLFSTAILQSASALTSWAYKPPQEAQRRARKFAKLVGCADEFDMQCLYKVDALSMFDHVGNIMPPFDPRFSPTLDGKFISEDPRTMLESGKFKKTSIIMGFNKNEANWFSAYAYMKILNPLAKDATITYQQFRMMLKDAVTTKLGKTSDFVNDAVEFQYRTNILPENTSYIDISDRIIGDTLINCAVLDFAKYYADSNNNVSVYFLAHRAANYPWGEWMGTIHGIDIDYVFGNPVYQFTKEEKELSKNVMSYWANFAKTGNPKGGSLPDWPLYSSKTGSYLRLDIGNRLKSADGLRARECAFWRSYIPKLVAATGNCQSSSATRNDVIWLGVWLSLLIFLLR